MNKKNAMKYKLQLILTAFGILLTTVCHGQTAGTSVARKCTLLALNIAVLSESGGSKYKTFQGGKHDYIFESRGATPA
jgi:hypothetical protein